MREPSATMDRTIPNGATTIFPIVGDPIDQVKSPASISAIFAARRQDAIVIPVHVLPGDLVSFLGSLETVKNAGGGLVTVPHKRAALACCVTVTDRARFIGAVNVFRRTKDRWHGDNTDGAGFVDGIERRGFAVAGKSVLLVGCGGAGAAIALELLTRSAAWLAIHDVDAVRRDSVIDNLSRRFPGRVAVGTADPTGFNLVANATPMGMKAGDPLPVDVSALRPEQFVACVVTKPEVPPLIEAARRLGCGTATGADMFDAQAEALADFLLGVSFKRGHSEENRSLVNSVS